MGRTGTVHPLREARESEAAVIPRKRVREKILATPDNPINRRRSERVVLQMKITVIAEDVQHNSRQEEAMTQVVNAHGGLLKMKMDVHVGQPMLLVNLKNGEEQNCRVVRV